MRIAFAGTPEFAATVLEALIAAGHVPCCVLTQPDRPAGRGRRPRPSAVKSAAEAAGLPVRQPPTLRDPAAVEALRALAPDLLVVVAYGLLLPPTVLALPRLGCVNVHASLLPRWRGAAPIQHAILAGDGETGVSIMQMDVGLDTGPVWHTVSTPVEPEDTGGTLHDRLAALGARALLEALPDIVAARRSPVPQDDARATHAPKIGKADAALDWLRPAVELERMVRAFDPWPVAHVATSDSAAGLRVWRAHACGAAGGAAPGTVVRADRDGILVACAVGGLLLTEVQPAGGRRMPVSDYLNARTLRPGAALVDQLTSGQGTPPMATSDQPRPRA
ncbi:MAG: methionyl-tRNA formyltransferase [Ectothiorhodospiraceae bacterium]|nr:methionyl-tRNA formyltransferase [Chromatiales bacterium]MCP5155058.1 methionyl-tRNA formyltransferase [Ectothiorhodospiraceae bacterium]